MLRWSGIAVVAGATTFLVAMGVRAWVADRSMRVNPLASITQLRARLDRGIALNPYEPIYRGIAGDALVKNAAVNPDKEAKTAILVEAVDRLKEMDELQPGHHLWKITVGDALGRLGETGELGAFAESEIWFSEALDLSHADWRVPARYGEMLNRWGTATGDGTRFCQALEQFDRALSLRITDASTHLGAGISHAYLGHLDRAEQHLRFAARIWRMHPNPSSEEVIAGKRAVITLRSVEQLRKEPPKSRACT
jgi:tetratricopeptide (TPR) repeat protein